MIARLVASGKRVEVVLAVPSGAQLDPQSMNQRSFLGAREFRLEPFSVEAFQKLRGGPIAAPR
jgi:hypothetical protein